MNMQDDFFIDLDKKDHEHSMEDKKIHIFGVFDGHQGTFNLFWFNQ